MNATAILLRSIVRICSAEAAIVDNAGELTVSGWSEPAAVAMMAAARLHQPLPNGQQIIYELAVPLEHAGRPAKLYIFDRRDGVIDSAMSGAIDILATELGGQLDRRALSMRELTAVKLGGGIGQIAIGIDVLSDPAVVFEWPEAGAAPRILYVNLPFESVFGHSAVAAIGQTAEFLHGPLTDRSRLDFMHERVRATREARSSIVFYRQNGVPVWIELSFRAVASTRDESCIVATLRDVTPRKEFEQAIAKEKRKLQVTLAAIGDGVITTVADGRIDFVNVAAQVMFGIDAAEAYGQPITDAVRLTDAAGDIVDVVCASSDRAGIVRGQARFVRAKSVMHIAFVTSPVEDEGYVVVLRDVTAQHRLATQLSYEASHDPLTSMYNRRKFDEVLIDAIESVEHGDGPHALAFLDLDRFKRVNDACGHAVGDRVLVDLAHTLQQQLRGRDVLARIGGDEFAVLLHDCSLENARRVLDKLRLAVESYRVTNRDIHYHVGVSIGLTAIDGTQTDALELFERADRACYRAKSAGRNAIAG